MKKRRNFILAMLLIVAMVIGIGYAALTRDLMITSTATLQSSKALDVQFVNGEVTATTVVDPKTHATVDPSQVAVANSTPTAGTYEITGLAHKGDSVTMEFTVKNLSEDTPATLAAVAHTEGSLFLGQGESNPGQVFDYFDKTVTIEHSTDSSKNITWANGTAAPSADVVQAKGFILQPDDTATVTITITLKKTIGATVGGDTVPDMITLRSAAITLSFIDNLAEFNNANP